MKSFQIWETRFDVVMFRSLYSMYLFQTHILRYTHYFSFLYLCMYKVEVLVTWTHLVKLYKLYSSLFLAGSSLIFADNLNKA